MFELVDSQPSHMVSVDALNLTPGKWTAYFFAKHIPKVKMNFNVVFFFFYVLTLTSQISQTRTGWSGSLIQKMKSLRSFPCEGHTNNDLLFSTVGERFGLFFVSEGKPEGMNINWRPLEPVQLQWCSQRVSHSVLLNSHWMLSVSNIETAWWKP